MKAIKYCVYQEAPYYVAQCLNLDVSSFGDSSAEAVANLEEALELYFEDAPAEVFQEVGEASIRESVVNG